MNAIEQEFEEEHESKYSYLAKLVFAYLLFVVGFYIVYPELFSTSLFIGVTVLLSISMLAIAAGVLICKAREGYVDYCMMEMNMIEDIEDIIRNIMFFYFLFFVLTICAFLVSLAGGLTFVLRQLTSPALLPAVILTLLIGLAGGIYYGLRETR